MSKNNNDNLRRIIKNKIFIGKIYKKVKEVLSLL